MNAIHARSQLRYWPTLGEPLIVQALEVTVKANPETSLVRTEFHASSSADSCCSRQAVGASLHDV